MKVINLLYTKYILSLLICLISSSVIFFVFSLLGNLDEEYLFNVIMKISFYNSLQILTYVPSFIFLLSVILFRFSNISSVKFFGLRLKSP